MKDSISVWEDIVEEKFNLLLINLINSNFSSMELFYKTPMQETETHISFKLTFAIIDSVI